MATLFKEIRYGIRSLLKRPGFSAIVVFTLALGIGANTAIFSVVMSVLISPLPYQNAERVVWLANRNAALGVREAFLNPADILDYREQSKSFAEIAAWGTLPLNLYGGRSAERVEGVYVTTNFFRTLGVRPILGRDFAESETEDNNVIVSYGFWQRQFGGDANVIGRAVSLGSRGNQSSTIVGVMPAEFSFPQHTDLFMTWAFDRTDTARGGSHNLRTIALLRPGVTVEQAQSEIRSLARLQAEQFPDSNAGWDVAVVPLREYLFGSARTALPLMLGAVVFVLLIACANVANLQLGRAVARRKEIAVRLALGAGRWRLIRQSLVESLLLSLIGSGLGLLLATWTLAGLRAFGPDSVPRLKNAALSGASLGFTLALAVLTALIFGIVPALQGTHTEIHATLKDGAGWGTTSRRNNRFRRVLVVSQTALALVLLIGASLLLRSFWKVQAISPGFQSEQVLTAGLSLSFGDYPNSARRADLFRQATERLSRLPGVTAVGAISHLPFGGRTLQLPFSIKGEAPLAGKNEAVADYRVVTPSFFETLRIPLKQGRALDDHDTAQTPRVFVISESFARTYFPGRNPLGVHLDSYNDLVKGEIVGVVGDVKHKGLEGEATPAFYVSYQQSSTFPLMNFLIRTQGEPGSLIVPVQKELQALDARGVVFNARPFTDFLTESVAPRRFNLWLLIVFATLAVVLAMAGIYGTMSYAVAQRTREIGIRMALGARATEVMGLIVRTCLTLTLIGVAIGLAAAFALTRLMTSLLFDVSPTDAVTFAVVPLLLIAVALLAGYLPARRATKVDPLVALRHE